MGDIPNMRVKAVVSIIPHNKNMSLRDFLQQPHSSLWIITIDWREYEQTKSTHKLFHVLIVQSGKLCQDSNPDGRFETK